MRIFHCWGLIFCHRFGRLVHPYFGKGRTVWLDYAPNFEEVVGAYCFRFVHPWVRPCIRHAFWCMPYEACMLGFLHGKIADPYIFSCPCYVPFWSYAPLKKSESNLVSKISRNVFELGDWNLVSWSVFSGFVDLCKFGDFKLVSKLPRKLCKLGA